MTSTLPMPSRMARLPRDKHDRPIPWFVHIDDVGIPDFRVIRLDGIGDAVRFHKCWVCGQRLGANVAFVVGPMCAINRVSAEPPAHRDCAIYSARACPFLATPKMQRRERGLPADYVDPPGNMITRNPGVALVWITRSWNAVRVDHGLLFEFGDAEQALWYAHGREATRAEVLAPLESGLQILHEADGVDPEHARAGRTQLAAQYAAVLPLLPPAPAPMKGWPR
jgi:hypothetical protein